MYYRVLQIIAEYCSRVLQSIAECQRVLQSIREVFRVLQIVHVFKITVEQSITLYHRVLQGIA